MAQLVARDVWDVDAAGSNPVTPTKKAIERLVLSIAFCLMCQFEAVLHSKMQVRIPRSEIGKLACQAKSVRITERSEVTLSFRPNLALGSNSQSLFLCFLRRNF